MDNNVEEQNLLHDDEDTSSSYDSMSDTREYGWSDDSALSLSHSHPEGRHEKEILYDDLVEAVSFGRYQNLLTVLAGVIDAGDAIEVMSLSFVMDPAADELNLSSAEKAWLSAVVFGGMLIGGYAWGLMSDLWGRRQCLMWSMFLNIIFGVAAGLAPTAAALIFCRFLSGLGVGGSMPVVFSYICEFLPAKKRGSYLVIVACFWMIGSLICVALAWTIIPLEIEALSSWRVFLCVCALPNVIGLVGLYFSPESPRFLLSKGRSTMAFKILAKIHKSNSGKVLQKRNLVLNYKKEPILLKKSKLSDVFTSTKTLFGRPLYSRTIKLIIVWMGLSFGSYGMMMWLPSYFEKRFGNTTGGISTYANSFLVTSSQLPMNLFSIYAVDKFGRKLTLAVSMISAGLAMAFVPVFKSQAGVIIMNCLFGSISMGGWNALNILSTELFPTPVRSTGFGLLSACGRVAAIIANVVFAYFVDFNAALPIILVAVFMIVGSVSAMLLPDSRTIIIM